MAHGKISPKPASISPHNDMTVLILVAWVNQAHVKCLLKRNFKTGYIFKTSFIKVDLDCVYVCWVQ